MHYHMIFYRENFLNLDIYYKYLTVEEIYQQPTFEFLSLLSEVKARSNCDSNGNGIFVVMNGFSANIRDCSYVERWQWQRWQQRQRYHW